MGKILIVRSIENSWKNITLAFVFELDFMMPMTLFIAFRRGMMLIITLCQNIEKSHGTGKPMMLLIAFKWLILCISSLDKTILWNRNTSTRRVEYITHVLKDYRITRYIPRKKCPTMRGRRRIWHGPVGGSEHGTRVFQESVEDPLQTWDPGLLWCCWFRGLVPCSFLRKCCGGSSWNFQSIRSQGKKSFCSEKLW
jgi:hypothetical protein